MKVQTKDFINMKEIEKEALVKLVDLASKHVKARLLEKLDEGKTGWDSLTSTTVETDMLSSIETNLEVLADKTCVRRMIDTGEYQERVLDIICASILLWNRI